MPLTPTPLQIGEGFLIRLEREALLASGIIVP